MQQHKFYVLVWYNMNDSHKILRIGELRSLLLRDYQVPRSHVLGFFPQKMRTPATYHYDSSATLGWKMSWTVGSELNWIDFFHCWLVPPDLVEVERWNTTFYDAAIWCKFTRGYLHAMQQHKFHVWVWCKMNETRKIVRIGELRSLLVPCSHVLGFSLGRCKLMQPIVRIQAQLWDERCQEQLGLNWTEYTVEQKKPCEDQWHMFRQGWWAAYPTSCLGIHFAVWTFCMMFDRQPQTWFYLLTIFAR